MHRGPQKTKLSLFRSNKSQASLLSTISAEPSEPQQRDDRSQRPLQTSQPSPISPVYSPISFPPNSASTSPLGPEDDKSPFKDYITAQTEETQQQEAPPASPAQGPRKLRRSLSHRSHPTAVGVGSQSGGTPKTLSKPSDSADPHTIQTSNNSQQKVTAAPEPKQKRRLWGFGEKSKDKNQTSGKTLGRSHSTRSSQHQNTASVSGISTSRQKWPISQSLPSPSEEEESHGEILTRKIQNRHSVAFPNPTVPEEFRSLVGSRAYDITPLHDKRSEDTSATTASSQFPSSGQEGAQRTPNWDRSGRGGPQHTRTVSHDQISTHSRQSAAQTPPTIRQIAKPELNFPEGQAQNRDSGPPSRQSSNPPSPSQSAFALHHKSSSVQSIPSISDSSMAPPPGGSQHTSGRNTDTPQPGQQPGNREGQYGSTLSVNAQQGNNSNYRNTPQASPMVQQNSNTAEGRNTPPPSRSRDDLTQLDVQQLVSKHEELNDKYRKVKKYYFDKDAQVQQLQNTLAHQRLAQSRTALDDNEYATRFSRLDGAINNLAFNIRKDWRAVPRWLAPYVNQEATSTTTKEMTAVGRACISRWIVDEIFDRYFHPALEPNLSSSLKNIERNLRRFAPPTPTEEEREALLAKISNWRLSTLDGLQDQLNMPEAADYRSSLTKILVEMLTSDLMANLKDPAPQGLEAGVIGIIELAVGISANLPSESRDVYVDYVMPGTLVNDAYMKIEGALPALTNPGEGAHDADRASINSAEADEEENGKDQQGGRRGGRGMFGSLIGGNKNKSQGSSAGRSQESVDQPPKDPKVRFAAFMSVEVRGKNMLIKAPVYI